jgi:serine palmitoyltransferase
VSFSPFSFGSFPSTTNSKLISFFSSWFVNNSYTGTSTDCLNLSSYNYLGFAEQNGPCVDDVIKAMKKYGVATGSPRMDAGTFSRPFSFFPFSEGNCFLLFEGLSDVTAELEKMIARFVGKPAALVFGMGYATNSTSIPALGGKGTLIISDSLNHNSIVTGCKDSGAVIRVFKHNGTNFLFLFFSH